VLNQTPSAFAQLIPAQAQNDTHPHSLRVVIFGGEALEPRSLRPWIDRNGTERPRLVNMYGITETTVHVTYWPLSENEILSGQSSVVGTALPHLRTYLLDTHGQPVPIDVPGEIYVGGAGVARGYLNRPGLTAERFIEDPFRRTDHSRLYKSGDLGRWRPDGTLEYLGRNDHQVKIRGFRIELGEIEKQLLRDPRLKDAVVLLREDQSGEKRLVAYFAPRGDLSPAADELRARLKVSLPEYMVPTAFVRIDKLPLTPNGKLDRKALPLPELEAYATRQYEAPQGQVERILVELWEALLQVQRIGRADNFFELGGHSLLATRVIVRVNALFSIDMPLKRLFERPTVQQFSAEVEHLRQMQLLGTIAGGESDVEELLRQVASMPEHEAEQQVLRLREGWQ
jgi:acyl carrier protein